MPRVAIEPDLVAERDAPAIGHARAPRARARIVLLPEPDGPMMHVMPGGHVSSTSSANSADARERI